MNSHVEARSAARGVVLVTGASTGVGRACALALDRAGFRVFAGVRSHRDAQALSEEASRRLTPMFIDVGDAASVAQAVDDLRRATGGSGLAGVVNGARVRVGGRLVAPRRLVMALAPLLRGGRVVDIGGARSNLQLASELLRDELRAARIHFAFVATGAVATERSRDREATTSPHAVADVVVRALTHVVPRKRYTVEQPSRWCAFFDALRSAQLPARSAVGATSMQIG